MLSPHEKVSTPVVQMREADESDTKQTISRAKHNSTGISPVSSQLPSQLRLSLTPFVRGLCLAGFLTENRFEFSRVDAGNCSSYSQ